MKKTLCISVLLAAGLACATVNYPYPQEKSYSYGTKASVSSQSSTLKSKFSTFLTNHYQESGSYARITYDEANYTVSEGIGYGMIMMVYFSDNTTSYQSNFDKLWAYYQNWENSNGLMNWKIYGFSSAAGSNGATDADEDVAFALLMAYYQFGDVSYLSAAKTLIANIRLNEFDQSSYLHKPGDAWDTYKNPSYVSPAAYKLFGEVDNSSFWTSAISANYTLLKANQNSTTGLPSGWSDASGNPLTGNSSYGTSYDYDAPRAPWRWAWSYAWFGDADAATLLAKLSSWLNTNKTAATVYVPMNLSTGDKYVSNNSWSNATAIGPLACALMYSSSYSTKLNSFTTSLLAKSAESYFNDAMQILSGLLLTGNMPNLAKTTATSSSSSVASSSSVKSSSSVASSSSAKSSSSVASSSSAKSSSSVASSSSAKSSSSVASSSSAKSSSSVASSSSVKSSSSIAASSSSEMTASSSSVTPSAGTSWTSETAYLSDTTSTSVNIGSSINWTNERLITKILGPVVSGTTYTLSFNAFLSCGGSALALGIQLGNDLNKTEELTSCATDTVSYSFVATETGTVTLTLTIPGARWESIIISNFKLISASGEDVTVPSSGNAAISASIAHAASAIQYTVSNDALYVTLPAAMNARIDVFDMQGRHITTLLSGFAQGSMELSLRNLQSGLYIIRATQGRNSSMFRAAVRH